MTAIVRIALARPYTFVVMAILVMIFGGLSAFRTPTDIFPNIGIPVISVVWNYNGLAPEQMEGGITTVFERVLTTTVNDISHIESTTLNGRAIVRLWSALNSACKGGPPSPLNPFMPVPATRVRIPFGSMRQTRSR